LSTLIDLFVNCAKELPRLSVILDAFDECTLGMREKIISILQHFHESTVRVFITTQSWLLEDLKAGPLEGIPTLLISADKGDVEEYIAANLPKKGINATLRKEIISKISSGVGEMYDLSFSLGQFAY
jgi:hypothetical protein